MVRTLGEERRGGEGGGDGPGVCLCFPRLLDESRTKHIILTTVCAFYFGNVKESLGCMFSQHHLEVLGSLEMNDCG